jgi:hypothetical protein
LGKSLLVLFIPKYCLREAFDQGLTTLGAQSRWSTPRNVQAFFSQPLVVALADCRLTSSVTVQECLPSNVRVEDLGIQLQELSRFLWQVPYHQR